MKKFESIASTSTPYINYDPESRVYIISGESRPEDVEQFYDPLMSWLDQLQKNIITQAQESSEGQKHEFIFEFEYYNSASGKYLYHIISKIDDIRNAVENQSYLNGNMSKVEFGINWHHDEEDDFMQEAGEEMQDATEIEITTKAIEDE